MKQPKPKRVKPKQAPATSPRGYGSLNAKMQKAAFAYKKNRTPK